MSIESHIRMSGQHPGKPCPCELRGCVAHINGKAVSVTRAQSDILAAINKAYPDPVSRGEMQRVIYGAQNVVDHALDEHVRRLNKRLAGTGLRVRGRYDVGWEYCENSVSEQPAGGEKLSGLQKQWLITMWTAGVPIPSIGQNLGLSPVVTNREAAALGLRRGSGWKPPAKWKCPPPPAGLKAPNKVKARAPRTRKDKGKAMRKCLSCGENFLSEHIGHRTCPKCKPALEGADRGIAI